MLDINNITKERVMLKTCLQLMSVLLLIAIFEAQGASSSDPLRSQLSRFEGQTTFLNPMPWYYSNRLLCDASADKKEANCTSSSKRAIQESDVFKVGTSGEKILYLLNNYRGLQVVSFAKGPEKPELIGRTEVSGNWSENLYSQEAYHRLLALETYWDYEGENSYTQLVAIDVSNPGDPQIAQTLRVEGTLVDSRMVGDVLYVATRSYSFGYDSSNSEKRVKAHIYSFQLNHHEMTQVDTLHLTSPLSYGELMSIVEVPQDNGFHYYLLAVLMGKGSWDSMRDQVAVIDISSQEGKIVPLMVSELRGTLRERSQLSIKDDALIAISNYRANSNLRIAVESFLLPTPNEKNILPQVVADYRQFRVIEAMEEKKGLMSEEELVLYRDQLVSGQLFYKGENLQLKGQFVEADNGMLKSLLPQSFISVGSTENLSASIQDVRFSDNFLYVYWVPQNQVDPLDVFDISHPREKVLYRGRLLFDGWIERAYPIDYRGHHYIVGLGQIVPAVGSEDGRRRPQAMLFELKFLASGVVKKEILSQITIGQDGHYWTHFNGEDKLTEIRFNDETGTGTILFQVYRTHLKQFEAGGKLVGFNLNQAISNEYDQIFHEGGFLKADQGWLKRVFSNPEIDKINSFSDMALETYDVSMSKALEDYQEVYKSMSVLELARNIENYFTLEEKGLIYGVQLIPDQYRWYSDQTPTLKLRLVNPLKADSEKESILDSMELSVRYLQGFTVNREQAILHYQTYTKNQNGGFDTEDFLALLMVEKGKLVVKQYPIAGKNVQDAKRSLSLTNSFWWSSLDSFINLGRGGVLFVNNQSFYRIQLSERLLTIEAMSWENCDEMKDGLALEIKQMNNHLYLHYYKQIQDKKSAGLFFQRHFLQPLTVGDGQKISCQKAVNIPGVPLSLVGDYLISNDTSVIDFYNNNDKDRIFDFTTTENLTATQLGSMATLTDLYPAEKMRWNGVRILESGTLVFLEGTEKEYRTYPWSVYRPHKSWNNYPQKIFFSYLNTNKQGHFVKDSYQIRIDANRVPTLWSIFSRGDGSYYGLLREEKDVRVLSITEKPERPVIQKLTAYDTQFRKKEAVYSIQTNGYFWDWSSQSAVHFTPELKSFELSEGLYGITQFFVE